MSGEKEEVGEDRRQEKMRMDACKKDIREHMFSPCVVHCTYILEQECRRDFLFQRQTRSVHIIKTLCHV